MDEFYFEDTTAFKNYGLEQVDSIRFHRNNLVIGKNGSGKTRFLKAVEAHYQQYPPKGAEVVTLYFPEIGAFFTQTEEKTEVDTAELGLSIFQGDPMNFQDFLKLAQRDSVTFLTDFFMLMSVRSTAMRQRYKEDFARLNSHLHRFLGWELIESKGDGKIIAHKFVESSVTRSLPLWDMLQEFSPGELMLFYFSLFLFYLEHVHNSKLVLIIDEPEQHLHPKVLLDLMETLMDDPSLSQLWIASHSLFLMPLFAFEQLVYVKHSRILKLNRNTYQDIYDDLVGLKNVNMYELLKSVENWAYYQFIAETFFLPVSKDVVNKSDEQFQKLLNSLQDIRKARPLKILDYGAGKFRIWECLKLELPDSKKREQFFCYEAYEPYPSSEVKCPDSVKLFTKEENLPHGHYDVVVLMNVLHEIDPFEWCHTFQTIYDSLTDQGVLIFLEVLSLTNGEQPYGEAGYLLLQNAQVELLFPNAQSVCLKESEKSNCWIIPRSDLANISFQDVTAAIDSLEDSCESQLEELDQERIKLAHKGDKSDKERIQLSARKYAFLAQQYINAHIAHKRMQQSSSPKKRSEKVTPSKIAICDLKPNNSSVNADMYLSYIPRK